MKKTIIAVILMILAGVVFFLAKNAPQKSNPVISANNIPTSIPAAENQYSPKTAPAAATQASSEFQPPLNRAAERVAKKPFGIFIAPETSPVQPEKFRGFHTGTDFEIFPDELNADIPVRAVCTGKIAVKRSASGYGSVLVQNCELNNQPITVVYGHLKLASIAKNAGDELSAGETIGILGKAYSPETDGERKHLHLGIHKGSTVNILGYVQSKTELSGWLDPCEFVCE